MLQHTCAAWSFLIAPLWFLPLYTIGSEQKYECKCVCMFLSRGSTEVELLNSVSVPEEEANIIKQPGVLKGAQGLTMLPATKIPYKVLSRSALAEASNYSWRALARLCQEHLNSMIELWGKKYNSRFWCDLPPALGLKHSRVHQCCSQYFFPMFSRGLR